MEQTHPADAASHPREYRPGEVNFPVVPRRHSRCSHRKVAQYFTGVARFDVSFGKVMGALEAAGHADDTLIVVLSDHGMSFPFSKATVYRERHWSPVMFRWPGLTRPGVDRDNMVSSVDIMPTVLDLLGIAPPGGMDGRSLAPLIRGESQPSRGSRRTHAHTLSSGRAFARRTFARRHVLMFHAWADGKTPFRVEAMTGLSYKAMADAAQSSPRIKARVCQYIKGTPLAFFDLETDPDERNNVIDDPRYRPEVERLQLLLLTHMERTNDPQIKSYRTAVAIWAKKTVD